MDAKVSHADARIEKDAAHDCVGCLKVRYRDAADRFRLMARAYHSRVPSARLTDHNPARFLALGFLLLVLLILGRPCLLLWRVRLFGFWRRRLFRCVFVRRRLSPVGRRRLSVWRRLIRSRRRLVFVSRRTIFSHWWLVFARRWLVLPGRRLILASGRMGGRLILTSRRLILSRGWVSRRLSF